MKHRAPFTPLSSLAPAVIAASALFAVGCETTIGGDGGADMAGTGNTGTSGTSGTTGTSGTSGTGVGGTSGGVGGVGGTTTTGVPCVGTHVTTAKRLVRLTDNQLVNTYNALFGATAAATMIMGEDIPPATNRDFPPLAVSGTAISQATWDLRDRLAARAMAYVDQNLATLTTCGAMPTDPACGQTAVLSFAQKAYRRPLTPDETASYQTLFSEITAPAPGSAGSVAEAIRYGYYAVLSSPGFLYRTEMGGDWNSDGPIDAYELASELSYFIMDGPPDEPLLMAAAANQLGKDQIRAEATRLLGTPAARANLEAAMVAYFQLTSVPSIIIDPVIAPGITVSGGLLSSMFREGELFMANTLWSGALGELVTSRRSWVNSQIAQPIYQVSVPSTDPMVFSEVMLPADRSGLLTLSPFLTSKTRAQGTSVVGRGLAVNAALVCSVNPPFPEDDEELVATIAAQAGWTEKQKADFRADPANGPCAGCHAQFDAMGLVLENYDAVGRYRMADLQGNVIDTNWTTSRLPESFDRDTNGDGVTEQVSVSSPAQLAQELLRDQAPYGNSNPLSRCMAMNFINFALADESQGSARAPQPEHPTNSCSVRSVTDQWVVSPDRSFTALIREIAASDTLALRSRGL